MKKRITVLFVACMAIACMLASGAQAAHSALNHAVARNLAASLRADLQIADRQPELAPLVNSTYVLLDALEAALAKNDAGAMRFAVEQYADELKLFQATAINAKCAMALVITVGTESTALLEIVSGGGTPLCMFINISTTIADMLSTTLGYQICIINGDSDNSTDKTTLLQKKKDYEIFSFTTSVLHLALCKRPLAVSDFTSLLLEYVRIFL